MNECQHFFKLNFSFFHLRLVKTPTAANLSRESSPRENPFIKNY
jgi:hypothetical protein